ncbi:geobacillin-26 family protein [Heliorestis convoluta]|uniref:Uncharacterized protein n=1 Tax=Heliorestis convoluta TaxID=356322 RepID=A0A5Q2N344_9FIRM|nr:geobacillin-26 family protein [Heliorestis convoluta]QGG47712.1 hypothetical protein FTV88_1612 [Heliorestis convoluta]
MRTYIKLLSLVVSLCLLLSFVGPSFAASVETHYIDGKVIKTEVLVDNESVRKVKVTENNEKTVITTYDKTSGNLEILETDNQTAEIKITNLNVQSGESTSIGVQSSFLHKEGLFFDGSYIISGSYWQIYNSNDQRKFLTLTTSNSTNLNNFKTAIDNMVERERSAIAAGGTTIVSTVVALFTTPPGLSVLLSTVTALGGTVTTGIILWNAYDYQKEADYYWGQAR